VVDVPKGGGDSVKVVSANGDKLAVAAEVGVELVLEVEEALVGGLGQGLLEPEDGGRKVGPDRVDRGGNVDLKQAGRRRREGVRWRRFEREEDAERPGETLDAEEVVAGVKPRMIGSRKVSPGRLHELELGRPGSTPYSGYKGRTGWPGSQSSGPGETVAAKRQSIRARRKRQPCPRVRLEEPGRQRRSPTGGGARTGSSVGWPAFLAASTSAVVCRCHGYKGDGAESG
jgi:hypothetical protein